MSAALVPAGDDRIGRTDEPVHITVDGSPVSGIAGQSLAGVLLAAGHDAWRTAPDGSARGVFCGIGICFDCVLTVNDVPDVRACRRRARSGDRVSTQTREQETR